MPNREVILGCPKASLHRTRACALVKPTGHTKDDQINSVIYDLFVMAGDPCEDKSKCTSYLFSSFVFSAVNGNCFTYQCDLVEQLKDKEWTAWQVPEWAISLAGDIRGAINKAEDVGKEYGYTSGLCVGKSFVKQLARGEIQVGQFEDADGRDERRLNHKKW